MKPTLLILGHSVQSYAAMALLGAVAAALYLVPTNRRLRFVPPGQVAHISLAALGGAVLGAKLLYMLVMLPSAIAHRSFFAANPALLAGYLLGGMVFYGGLLGGLAGGVLYCRAARLRVQGAMALFAPAIPLFHAFARVGCLLAGCCHGIAYAGRFAVTSPAAPGATLLPVQGIEALGNLGLFVLCAVLVRRLQKPWRALYAYLCLYAIQRFVLEFWRGDSVRGEVWLLSTSQWISLALLVALALGALLHGRRRETESRHTPPHFAPRGNSTEPEKS